MQMISEYAAEAEEIFRKSFRDCTEPFYIQLPAQRGCESV
jgi:hypothetical protein